MLGERAQGLVAVEADAVQVVGLALGPLRGRREVDDARDAPVAHGDALAAERASGQRQDRAHHRLRALAARVQARDARAARQRLGDARAVLGRSSAPALTRAPARVLRSIADPGSASAAAVSAGSSDEAAERERHDRPAAGRGAGACAVSPAGHGLDQRVAEAQEAEREEDQRDDDGAGVAGLDAADGDHELGDEQRRGWKARERGQAAAHDRARARVCARDARAADARRSTAARRAAAAPA